MCRHGLRVSQDEDTCYSFWIGASLHLLGAGGIIDTHAVSGFASCCQYVKGGIAKVPGAHPDVLHSYYALAGLSLAGHAGLAPLDPRFGISKRACDAAGLRRAPLLTIDGMPPPPCAPCDEDMEPEDA